VAAAGVLLLGASAAPGSGSDEAADLLREGVARAERGDLEEAEHAFFGALAKARDPALAADAYHDLGVAALARRDFEAARSAFFDSLALRPGDRRTQYNLEWTLIALESAAAPQPSPSKRGEEEGSDPAPSEPDRRPSEPKPGEPSAELQRPDEEQPESAARPDPGARDGNERRRSPVELDPEAAERWLQAVEEDPRRALRASARTEADRGRRKDGPRW
jgi:tetratricopeptide (TPR) repeat protein